MIAPISRVIVAVSWAFMIVVLPLNAVHSDAGNADIGDAGFGTAFAADMVHSAEHNAAARTIAKAGACGDLAVCALQCKCNAATGANLAPVFKLIMRPVMTVRAVPQNVMSGTTPTHLKKPPRTTYSV